MKREDFKIITENHIETCKSIIEKNGSCNSNKINCWNCPFDPSNLTNKYSYCGDYIHPETSCYSCDGTKEKLKVNFAQDFINKFSNKKVIQIEINDNSKLSFEELKDKSILLTFKFMEANKSSNLKEGLKLYAELVDVFEMMCDK